MLAASYVQRACHSNASTRSGALRHSLCGRPGLCELAGVERLSHHAHRVRRQPGGLALAAAAQAQLLGHSRQQRGVHTKVVLAGVQAGWHIDAKQAPRWGRVHVETLPAGGAPAGGGGAAGLLLLAVLLLLLSPAQRLWLGPARRLGSSRSRADREALAGWCLPTCWRRSS